MCYVAVIVEKRFHEVLFIILVLLIEFEVFRFFFVQKMFAFLKSCD